jgi:hypothetical protein
MNSTDVAKYNKAQTQNITNPSAFYPLRVFSQDRSRNATDKAPPAPPAPKFETRAELEKRGSAITMKKIRVATKFGDELRECPQPLWQAEGADSLNHWVTDITEQGVRDSQKAVPAAPRVQKVVDTWSAPRRFASVQPGGDFKLPLAEEVRYLIECDEEVGLQISNLSSIRTLRLRNRDAKTGECSHVAFVPPMTAHNNFTSQYGVVTANGKSAAVIELMPQ